ncbi:hypothetical protein ColTof4_08615 [Colletotrichum tofieldiae]|nr:hypothetical protein ColTof4_08615 [Colletotrichum tofieldiae]
MAPTRLHLETNAKIPENSTFKDYIENPGLIVHLAAIVGSKSQEFEAVECVLYWQALRADLRYNATEPWLEVANYSQYDEGRLVGSEEGEQKIVFDAPCNHSNGDPRDGNDTCEYIVTNNANLGLRNLLIDFFTGYVYREPTENAGRHGNIATDLLWQSFKVSQNLTSENPLQFTLNAYVNNVASLVSLHIRTASDSKVFGETWAVTQFWVVKWRNIPYMALLLALSTYLFSFAMWRTWGQPTWKNSVLPFLYHGFEHPAREQGKDSSNLVWMERASKQKHVVLRNDFDGLGLKLREREVSPNS